MKHRNMFANTYQRSIQVSTFPNMKTEHNLTFFGKWKSGDAEVLR